MSYLTKLMSEMSTSDMHKDKDRNTDTDTDTYTNTPAKIKQTVKVVIRNAKMTDLKMMKEVNERCLQENYDIDFWHQTWESNKSCCFVAICGAKVVAYVLANTDHIVSFAVDEEYRNKRIGKELMKHVLNNFKSNIRLNVRTSNTVARKLYTNLGFTNDITVKDYYRNPVEDSIEMVRKYDTKNIKYTVNDKMKITINDNTNVKTTAATN